MSSGRIEILLATRNGADWLDALLRSILGQDRTDFILRVRDDGSDDETMAVLARHQEAFGGRMLIEENQEPSGSAKANFARLLEASEGDYLLFADQDDVWLPNRVSETMRLLQGAETRAGRDVPVYAFTDVIPVRGDLSEIGPSFFRFKKIDPSIAGRLAQSLVCPPMLGCASGINRALAELALPIPVEDVTGHDWWALLLAVAAGQAVWSTKATVRYRLHGANASSQVETAVGAYARMGGKSARVRRGMMLRQRQAAAVAERLVERGRGEDVAVVERFAGLGQASAVGRRLGLVRGGYLYPDWIRTLAMLALC